MQTKSVCYILFYVASGKRDKKNSRAQKRGKFAVWMIDFVIYRGFIV
jgi:hypothetical protein